MPKIRPEVSVQLNARITSGCSKKLPSKAAGESKPEAYPRGYVEGFDESRTKPGERRVSARWGWAGENSDIFSILLFMQDLIQTFPVGSQSALLIVRQEPACYAPHP